MSEPKIPDNCPHADRPHFALGMCRSCYEKDLRKRNPDFAEKQRQNNRRWMSQPGNRERVAKSTRARQQSGGSRAHRAYRISREEYDRLMAQPCGICGGESKHLDHDHRHCPGGKGCRECIRGALCHRCNLGMGYLEGWFEENREQALSWRDKRPEVNGERKRR